MLRVIHCPGKKMQQIERRMGGKEKGSPNMQLFRIQYVRMAATFTIDYYRIEQTSVFDRNQPSVWTWNSLIIIITR